MITLKSRILLGIISLSCLLVLSCVSSLDVQSSKYNQEKYSLAKLLDAIYSDNFVRIRQLLDEGLSPNDFRAGGPSCHPLLAAAYIGNVEVVALLVEYGADADGKFSGAKYPPAVTPIATACAHTNNDVVTKLVDLGANVNAGSLAERPIIYASLYNNVEALSSILNGNPTRASMIIAARFAWALDYDECFGLIVMKLNGGHVPKGVRPENWLEHVLDGASWPIESWEVDTLKTRQRYLMTLEGLEEESSNQPD